MSICINIESDIPWPPVDCHNCNCGRFLLRDSDIDGYAMVQCEECQHKVYQLLKTGKIIEGNQDS